MYCIRCGQPNIPGAKFCHNCGTPVVEQGKGGQVGKPEESPPSPLAPPPVPETSSTPDAGNPGPFSGAQSSNSQNSAPNFQPYNSYPANPYGLPMPHQQIPLAPNGQPYPVANNPDAFFSYTDKEGKKVYAAIAPLGYRILSNVIDALFFILIYILILVSYLLTFSETELNTLLDALNSKNMDKVQNYFPAWINLLVVTLFLIYCTLLLWLNKGQTIGKKFTKIKVIKLDGSRPKFNTALLRSSFGYSLDLGNIISPYGPLLYLLGFGLTMMVWAGFAAILFNKRHRGWHDVLAETIVVRTEELVQGRNY